MNVLQIVPELELGGVEKGTVEIARGLVERGHHAVVVSAGGVLVKKLQDAKAVHYTVPVHYKSPFSVVRAIRSVCQIIDRERIDIVHARSRVPAIIGFFAARRERVVFMTTAHGFYRPHLFSRVMGWGKLVIALSNAVAKNMITSFGVLPERIRLIPRGVDTDEFSFVPPLERRHREFTVGIVGRITPLKGHDTFLQAVAIARRTLPNMRAVIVGTCPVRKRHYYEKLHLMMRQLGLANCVSFLGRRDDIPAVLGEMDVLVCATRTPEAFGRVIIEAQAKGVPVVATKVGGIVDIIEDGINGLLSEPNDAKQIAQCISRLATDLALRQRLAMAARKRVEERFTLALMVSRTLAVYEEIVLTRDILVIKMSALGDVVLSVPALRALREKFPQAKIHVLVDVRFKEILLRCPFIDEVITYDSLSRDRGFRGLFRVLRVLQARRFDMVIDLQNNRMSHLLAYLSGAPDRYGYDGKWGRFLNHVLRRRQFSKGIGPIEHQFKVLGLLGITSTGKERVEISLLPEHHAFAEQFLDANWVTAHKPLIGLNVGASNRWISKRWPAQQCAVFCDMVAKKYNARVLLTGACADASFAQEILSHSKAKPINAVGKTSVLECAALIAKCVVFVTTDSAAMHLAAGVGVPFVALFGPTDPVRHLPGNCRSAVIAKEISCRPCYRGTCVKKTSCMMRIAPEDVLAAVQTFLEPAS